MPMCTVCLRHAHALAPRKSSDVLTRLRKSLPSSYWPDEIHLFGVINNQLSYSWEKRGFRHVITCKREFLETFNLISTRIVERKRITMRREL